MNDAKVQVSRVYAIIQSSTQMIREEYKLISDSTKVVAVGQAMGAELECQARDID